MLIFYLSGWGVNCNVFHYGEHVIVWDENENPNIWKYDNTMGAPCVFDNDSGVKITYEYDTEKPVSARFVPVYKEGGSP